MRFSFTELLDAIVGLDLKSDNTMCPSREVKSLLPVSTPISCIA